MTTLKEVLAQKEKIKFYAEKLGFTNVRVGRYWEDSLTLVVDTASEAPQSGLRDIPKLSLIIANTIKCDTHIALIGHTFPNKEVFTKAVNIDASEEDILKLYPSKINTAEVVLIENPALNIWEEKILLETRKLIEGGEEEKMEHFSKKQILKPTSGSGK